MEWVLAHIVSSIGPASDRPADVLLVASLLAVLALSITVAVLLLRRRQPDATTAETELEILWQAMDAHALVNISDAEGRIVYVNETFVKYTGYSREELIGNRLRDLLLTAESADSDLVAKTIRDGSTWVGETKFHRKDGSLFWTRSSVVGLRDRKGRLVRSVSLRTDITESKLRQAEAQSRAMLDGLPDEVYMFSARDLRLIYLNARARELHGWVETDYRGKTLLDAAPSLNVDELRERLLPLIHGKLDSLTFENDDMGRPVEVCLQLERGYDGQMNFLAVVRDIAQRKEAEQARTQFVATVSHELRSPLTSVMGALKLVTSGAFGALPQKPSALLEVALRNVDRVVLMINDLLDLEKLDAGRMDIELGPTDMSDLIAEAVAANISYAEELGVRIVHRGTERPCIAEANHPRMIQVLNNLLSNAAKFSRPGGVVEVELHRLPEGLRISVQDSGIGIPKEDHGRIFERFSQSGAPVDKRRNGTGLGLSITKAIVERHGGSIRFTSEAGVGTTFWIDLPMSQEMLGAA